MVKYDNCSMCGKQLNPDTVGCLRLDVQAVRAYRIKFVYPFGQPKIYFLCCNCAEKVKEMIEHGESGNT